MPKGMAQYKLTRIRKERRKTKIPPTIPPALLKLYSGFATGESESIIQFLQREISSGQEFLIVSKGKEVVGFIRYKIQPKPPGFKWLLKQMILHDVRLAHDGKGMHTTSRTQKWQPAEISQLVDLLRLAFIHSKRTHTQLHFSENIVPREAVQELLRLRNYAINPPKHGEIYSKGKMKQVPRPLLRRKKL